MVQLLAARCLPLPAEEVGWTKQGWGRERAPLEVGGEEEGGMGSCRKKNLPDSEQEKKTVLRQEELFTQPQVHFRRIRES